MPLLPNEREALNSFRTAVVTEYGALAVTLFGSKARGTDTPESDLDVAVILPEQSPAVLSAIDDLAFEINLEHDCLIVPLCFAETAVTDGPMSESPIYKRVVREGVAL